MVTFAYSKHKLLVLYATPVLLRAPKVSYVLYQDIIYKSFIRFLLLGIVLSIGHYTACFSVAERIYHTQGNLLKSFFALMVSRKCIGGGRRATGASRKLPFSTKQRHHAGSGLWILIPKPVLSDILPSANLQDQNLPK